MSLKKRNSHEGDSESTKSGLGLSFRLATFYAIIFVVAAYGLFALAYIFIIAATRASETAAIADRIQDYRIWYREGGFESVGARFLEHSETSPDVFFLRVISEQEKAVLYSNPRSESLLNIEAVNALNPDLSGFRINLSKGDLNSWTVVADKLAPGLKIQVGKSNDGGEAVIHRFKKAFLYFVVPTLLLGLIGGVFVGYQAMLPIRRLASTIRNILTTGDLKQRATTESDGNELNDLCLSFNQLLEKNQSLVEVTRNSLDNVSHDLRTPLTRLRATLEQSLSQDVPVEKVKDACGEGIESCDDLLLMLEALMESSEAATGLMRLAKDEINVAEIVETASELFDFVAEERAITIQRQAPKDLEMIADRSRLLRLLANLIDNAIKFSRDGEDVSVSAQKVADDIVFRITNKGPVIKTEDLPRIWDRLFRGDSSRSTRGLGLGLSFVKAIAEAHGGSASVASHEREGTTFTVTIPIKTKGAN